MNSTGRDSPSCIHHRASRLLVDTDRKTALVTTLRPSDESSYRLPLLRTYISLEFLKYLSLDDGIQRDANLCVYLPASPSVPRIFDIPSLSRTEIIPLEDNIYEVSTYFPHLPLAPLISHGGA